MVGTCSSPVPSVEDKYRDLNSVLNLQRKKGECVASQCYVKDSNRKGKTVVVKGKRS